MKRFPYKQFMISFSFVFKHSYDVIKEIYFLYVKIRVRSEDFLKFYQNKLDVNLIKLSIKYYRLITKIINYNKYEDVYEKACQIRTSL